MSGFQRLAYTAGVTLSAALAAVAVAALPAAQASVAPASALTVPSACKTFTARSADALFGVRKGTHLREKSTRVGRGKNEVFTCTISHHGVSLKVTTAEFSGGFGGPLKCYKRTKLGRAGEVCVSTVKTFPFSLALFVKHKIVFVDSFTKTLPHQGRSIYTFALAQYKAFKG
jgi:hypothetical protein